MNIHKHLHRYWRVDDAERRSFCLLWAEMEYDVKHTLYRKGKVLVAEGASSEPYVLTADDDDFLLRAFSEATDNIRGRLEPYIEDRSMMVHDELLDKPSEFTFVLRIEPGWTGSMQVLMNWAHQYVVNYTRARILTDIGDRNAARYEEMAERALYKLHAEANAYDIEEPPIFML